MARRRSRLRPALVALGLAVALAPLAWPDGGGPVDAVVDVVVGAIEGRTGARLADGPGTRAPDR